MENSCRNQLSCMKNYCSYCCRNKKELLRNNEFERSIEITPRVIICKSLTKCETYYQSLDIQNLGIITRRMHFFVDSESEVSFKANGNPELIAGASIKIEVYVEPRNKKDINRPRFFYIFTEHPDIVFQVPIIVMKVPLEIFVPSSVCLYKVPANTTSHFQFIIYNPFECELPFSTSSTYENIQISKSEDVIPARNFCKILLTGKIPNQVLTENVVIKINGKCYKIMVHMKPSDRIIHLSSHTLIFNDMYMGLKQQKSLHICNKGLKDVSFEWTTCSNSQSNQIPDTSEELKLNNILTIKTGRGCISSLSSALSIITLCPLYANFPEEEEPPFKVNVTVYLRCPLINSQLYQLQILGTILGPDIDINPRDTDFGNIYVGEMMCLNLKVTNKGPIDGEIYIKECTDEADIRWTITPNSISLKPRKSGVFALKFYRRNLGKFLTKLTFKIRCGNVIPILLRGNSKAVQVKIWPDSFELSEIPVCVPQKRFALIANPLPVPIVVEPSILNEGTDDPLILSVDNSQLTLHTGPTPYLENISPKQENGEMKPSYSDFELVNESNKIERKRSDFSFLFEDKVLDNMPAMAGELLKNIKEQRPQLQPEPGAKIIDVALNCLLNRSDYFYDLKEKQSFLNMDWESLPKNPKEIAIENERFYLKANESKSFPVILIPNSIGPNIKTIQFRSCPLGLDQTEITAAISSTNMINALRLEYKCVVPDLVYKSEIKFQHAVYVDKVYHFQMHFENRQNVPGFFYFKPLPDTAFGSLTVSESHKKCFIHNGETVTVAASVTYRKVGNISLAGMFHMVGRHTEYSFTVNAEVLPPKLRIRPRQIIQKQQVLECTTTKVFIENISMTIAKFSALLTNDENQNLEPLGGHLAPGQKMLVSVSSRFSDPGVYKNLIILYLTHSGNISIPLRFTVEGIPLTFSPNIKLGLDCGTVFSDDKGREYPINIKNDGNKSYRVIFMKQKPKGNIVPPIIFNVQPPGIIISPMGHVSVKLILNASKPVQVEQQFDVEVIGEDNTRFKFFNFSCKCDVINPKVIWSKPEVHLKHRSANEFDSVDIINLIPLQINVNLTVSGFFTLIEVGTFNGSKTHSFQLEGRATKQFLVKIDESQVDTREFCQCFEGIVKCKANGKQQKNLGLHAKIINPGIKICNPEVTFFTQNIEAYAHITLRNDGSVPAKYCWQTEYTRICQTAFEDTYECNCAKTISEIILDLSDECLPFIPKFINTTPEVYFSDEEYSEDNDQVTEAISNAESSSVDKSNKSLSSVRTVGKDLGSIEEPLRDQIVEPQLNPSSHGVEFEIEHVFSYLGLPIPKEEDVIVRGNTDGSIECGQGDASRLTVKFQDKQGVVLPKTLHKTYIFIPYIPKGWTLFGKYYLEVKGGETKHLHIQVSSLKGRIQVSQTHIDILKQIWCKAYIYKLKLTNPCPYAVKIKIIDEINKCAMSEKLMKGSLNVISPKSFVMMPGEKQILHCQVILGLCYDFVDDIRIEVNNNTTRVPIRFQGSGLMPMILPKSINNMTRKTLDTLATYLTMRNLYNSIELKNKSKQGLPNEDNNISTSVTMSEEDEIESVNFGVPQVSRSQQNFVGLHYSEESGPHALEIERLIETWKFKSELEKLENLRQHFHQYYCQCISLGEEEFNPVVNLKFTICRPIPWEMSAYVLDMGDFAVNESKHFHIDLTFLGPGRVFLSARTRVGTPGLMAWFNESYDANYCDSFLFYIQSPEENKQKLCQNKREKDMDVSGSQSDVKITHAHSFDIDSSGVHQREREPSKEPKIKEHYNKISFPNKAFKDPLILAEICQIDNGDWHDSTFQLVILFTAFSGCFEINQTIDDYLLIDVHLGLTLPIQLHGRITSTSSNELLN